MSGVPVPWVAHDPASERVVELARSVAETSTTVLITGESGTGKDQLARLIHELSPRRDAPYLKIDCASLPQELVESELFGHERGAFTGAVERKFGRLEMAGGGTIVLDEVAALTSGHAIEAAARARRAHLRAAGRHGNAQDRRAPDRAHQCRSGARVASRCFRRRLVLPPERAHGSGAGRFAIGLRTSFRWPNTCSSASRSCTAAPDISFSDETARQVLLAYGWPGNVRELEKRHRASTGFSPRRSVLALEDFPESIRTANSGATVELALP